MAVSNKCYHFLPKNVIIHHVLSNAYIGYSLTHLSLASLLWDIGKQNSPRCYSVCLENVYRKMEKITPDAPKNKSGLTP